MPSSGTSLPSFTCAVMFGIALQPSAAVDDVFTSVLTVMAEAAGSTDSLGTRRISTCCPPSTTPSETALSCGASRVGVTDTVMFTPSGTSTGTWQSAGPTTKGMASLSSEPVEAQYVVVDATLWCNSSVFTASDRSPHCTKG